MFFSRSVALQMIGVMKKTSWTAVVSNWPMSRKRVDRMPNTIDTQTALRTSSAMPGIDQDHRPGHRLREDDQQHP